MQTKRVLCTLVLLALTACTNTKPEVSFKPVSQMMIYNGMSQQINAAFITPAFFQQTPGLQPFLGRLFKPGEYNANPTVGMVSHACFTDRFNAVPANTIGNMVFLKGVQVTIIGVLPPSFPTPNQAEVLIPKDKLTD